MAKIKMMGEKKAFSKKDWGLSGSLGLMLSCSIAPAMAHGTVMSTTFTHTPTPVIHTVTKATTSNAAKVTSATSVTTNHSASGTTTHALTFTGGHIAAGTTSLTSPAMNLQSTAANFTLSTLGNFKTVTIDVGGKSELVTSTTKLTAAEFLAADQAANAANAATQGLTINSHGVATGGDVILNNKTLQTLDASTGGLGSLLVPKKVTLDDELQILNLTGNLTNYGTVDANYATGTGGSTIHAANIANGAGATINGAGALTLTADQSLTNAGSIKSASDLTINATTVQNTSATSTVNAGHNLVINAPTVNNSGTLSAKNDVNFTSQQSITLTQTANGTVSAGNNINFRDASYTGSGDIFINGGNLLSTQLNVYAPTGEFGLNAGNVTGMVNGTVGAVHSDTEAPLLVLGNLNIAGDPAFYNTGSIAIGGDIRDTNGVPLAIIAGNNILSDGGSLTTGGGDLTLIAGAKYTTNTMSDGGPDWSTTINLMGGNSLGGSIELTGLVGGTAPVTAVSTAVPAGTTGNGGNVLMIAFLGTNDTSGHIVTPNNVTINTNGADVNSPTVLSTNGNVQLFASAGIATGGITANGATGGGGVITLETGNVTTPTPFAIVNGQPMASASDSGLGQGPIQFGTINGYQAIAGSNQVGGSFNVVTVGAVTPTSSITDGGIFITTGQNFNQSTTWQAGGMSVTTPGTFTQTSTGYALLDGVGGQYNISAGNLVDFEGTTVATGGTSPASVNVTTAANGKTYIGLNTGSSAYINADIFTVSNSSVVTVNGTLFAIRPNDVPPGGGNVSFNNGSGSLQLTGSGTINNSGTFTATSIGNVIFEPGLYANTNTQVTPNGWVFSAGSLLQLPTASLTVAPDPLTGNGGNVSLTYNTFSYTYLANPSQSFYITANGGGGSSGNGGTVTLNATTQGLTVGTGLNQFNITANSDGNTAASVGGQVNLSSAANMIINSASLSNTGEGTGGSVFATPTKNLAIIGTLNESPLGGSPVGYGAITLNMSGETASFNVGLTTTPSSGVQGNLIGDVTINSPLGVTVSANASITGNAIALTGKTIQNSGLIQGTNLAGSQEISSSVSLNTPALTNNATGEIGALNGTNGTSTISVTSPTALVVSGTGKFDSTFGYSFNAATTLNLGPVFNTTSGANSNPTFETLALTAGTGLTIGTASLATLQTTSQKTLGSISISAATVSYANSSLDSFSLNANGSVTGGITVNLTGTSVATQKIGTTAGSYTLQVVTPGAAAGVVSFTSATGLSVNTSLAALDNVNGNLTLTAKNAISIVGSIAQGNGNVTITSPITNAFLIGTTTTPVSGIMGNISGALITISNGSGITLESGSNVTALTSVNLTGPAITNNGSIIAPTSISLSSSSNLTVAGTGTYGVTGTYEISGANVSLVPLFATSQSNVFDSLNIAASGSLNLSGTNILQSAGNATNGISITDKSLVYKDQSTTAFTLNTSSATGGGNVSYTSTGTTTMVVGNAAGDFIINTSNTGAGAATGSISLSNPGTLLVNPSYLLTTTSLADTKDSTNISLTAGSGYLLVSTGVASTGWYPALLGASGNLNITANTAPSLGVFTVGSASGIKSGIFTSTPVTGGSISISNALGSIYLSNQDILQGAASGGSVSLSALNSITGAVGVETIVAPTINLTSTTGTIGLATAPLIVNTPTNTSASSLAVSSPVAIYIQDNSAGYATPAAPPAPAGPATIVLTGSAPIFNFFDGIANAPLINLTGGLPAATTVSIVANGSAGGSAQGIETAQNIGNGLGVVTLNAGTGTITEMPVLGANSYSVVLIQGTTVALTAGDVLSTNPNNSALQTFENALTFNGNVAAGHLIVDNNFYPVTLNAGTTTNFNLLTHGEVTVAGVQTNSTTYNLTSWGQETINANINSAGTVTLQTISGGYFISNNGAVVSGSTVNLDSDYGNVSSLIVNTANLNIGTLGSVVVTNQNAGANSLMVTASPVSLSLVDLGQFTLNSALSTTNGSVLIQNNNTASGTIAIASGETIHASSTETGLGNVTLTIGAAPTTPQAGVVPPNTTINETGGGLVYFGSSAFPSGTITTGTNITLNADGRNILFNSDNRPTAISLNGNNTITADPPVGNSTPQFLSQPLSIINSVSTVVANQPANALQVSSQNSIGGSTISNASGSSVLTGGFTGGTHDSSSSLLNGANSLSALSPSTLSPSTPSSSYLTLSTLSPAISASSATLNNAVVSQTSTSSSRPDSTSAAAISSTNTNGLLNKTLQGGVAFKHHHSAQSQEVDHKALQTGAVILGPDRATSIDTPFGRVEVAAKSLVIVVATDKALSIFNFHDEARKAVQIISSAGGAIEVGPGRHVTLSKVADDKFENVNPALFIPYRAMKSYQSGDVRVYNSEFHLASAIQGFQPLKDMMASADHEKQKMASKVFKTIALLQMLSKSQGEFEFITPKPLTASIK
jgi:fibronectin-binding autotransporter adhesin